MTHERSRHCATHFREQNSGAYVHMTSTSGLIGNFGQANYMRPSSALSARRAASRWTWRGSTCAAKQLARCPWPSEARYNFHRDHYVWCMRRRHDPSAERRGKFRELGFISYNGHLEVHNSLLNVILHDKPQIRRGDNAK